MQNHLFRRVVLGALVLITTLTVVAPVEAATPIRKLEPRRTVPYRVGRVFTPNTDVVSVSGYAAWMIDEVLGATTSLPALGVAFMRAERQEGINARFFVAHAMLESGWGTSAIARYKRNLFGYNAYDRDPWKNAWRFTSHARGVARVAEILRDAYLTPGGRRWYGFTTPRAINRYYASDPRWADKVAVLANVIDYLVVTLRERGIRFRRPVLLDRPLVGVPATLEIPWISNPGARLPDGLRFAVRWTPLAVVEASTKAPTKAPCATWRLARRTDGPDHAVQLRLKAPALPGVWRLDVEARDTDGQRLPQTDRPAIRSLEVRVAAPGEFGVALAVGDNGSLEATVRVAGDAPAVHAGTDAATAGEASTALGEVDSARELVADALPAPAVGIGPSLEIWTLPVDPAIIPYVTQVPLADALGPDAAWTVSLGDSTVPAVVVARVAGSPGSVIRALPTVALTGSDANGRLTLSSPAIASLRDDLLLNRTPAAAAPAPVTLRALDEPGTVEVTVAAGDLPPAAAAMAPLEDVPGPRAVLVRTLAVDAACPAAPTDSLMGLPGAATGAARLALAGLPGGVRLVMAGLVPRDGGPVDPATLSLAWVAVTATPAIGAARS